RSDVSRRSARPADHRESAAGRAGQRAGHALVRQRDAGPVQALHSRPRPAPDRALPRVGGRFRREAQARLQGTVTAMAYEFATYERQGRIPVVTINPPDPSNSL